MNKDKILERAYNLCVSKIRKNIITLSNEPKSGAFDINGNYFKFTESFFDIENWTTSFFTGMALIAYETTKDKFFLEEVKKLSSYYKKKIFEYNMDTMHDLGFLYTLYSVALYKLTDDKDSRVTALKAADELTKRFNFKGNYIRAWGRMDDSQSEYIGMAIIDCMMNIPLLFWASEETKNNLYHDIAVSHADSTMQNFIRKNGSIFHSFSFDINTGKPVRGDNYCGYNTESHWARGTAWAMYGFAIAYGYTKDQRYLETSKRIAYKFIENLDEEIIPLWDFKLPSSEDKTIRDSSAASIAVCGLYELQKYFSDDKLLYKTSEDLLNKLCSEEYTDYDLNCPGILKKSEIAKIHNGMAIAQNVYSSWGDYFFMEALAKKIYNIKGFW